MTEPLQCIHMNHVNVMVEDYERSIEHLRACFGAQLNAELPGEHWNACLVTIGGVMFEVFAPLEYLLHARVGPHYVGVEYQVPDVEEARSLVAGRGMRVIRDLGQAIHIHPEEAYGVSWELWNGSFQGDPPPMPYLEPLRSAEGWRSHPLGYTGLRRLSVAVGDLTGACRFAEEFLGATRDYDIERPAAVAHASGFRLGDTTVELLGPTGPGPVERYLARYGDGLRSTVFAVADVDVARRHLAAHGLAVGPGDSPDTVAVGPADNLGLIFEFTE